MRLRHAGDRAWVERAGRGGAPPPRPGGARPPPGGAPGGRPGGGPPPAAAARRYSGAFRTAPLAAPLPRVRYWMAWNEPNRDYFLMPQFVNRKMVSATHYRAMVRSFSAGVKRVHPSNLVVSIQKKPMG
jgi:hypothetical protein